MSPRSGPAHVVVDGSNLATEGRSMPSLAQLSDAVGSFMEEYPDAAVTVVVDATFGHRIDKKEVPEFEEGIANNELVAPPAGAVGRGDAFVLSIADKAGATVLSNDSFQEFHGEYEWLFDVGRLVGGKPVPHVGWVFVDRVPVRGPVSRKATRGTKSSSTAGSKSDSKAGSRGGSKSDSKAGSRGGSRSSGSGSSGRSSRGRRSSKAASEPMPVPTSPPPGATGATGPTESGSARPAPKGQEPVNELLPFLEFVEHHPVGTSVNGTVDSYSSHGAYITIGDEGVRGYIPLRLMSDPPPRSARKVMAIGESVTVVVASFSPARRSIDCALPDMAGALPASESKSVTEPASERAADEPAAKRRKRAAKKSAAKKSAAKKTPVKTSAAKSAAKKSAAKKTATKKTATEKSTAKTSAKTSARRKTAAKKTAAKKTAGKKTAGKKTTATRSAKKSAAKKSSAKKSSARKSPSNSSGRRAGGSSAAEG